MNDNESYEYDVCLSFAGEDRCYVEQVAASLRALHIGVFYDNFEQVELWGKDLYSHLDDVYRKRARFCVIFISEHYVRKLWTSHERRSAQARAFLGEHEYILPARFDESDIPGIPPTIGTVYLRGMLPDTFANLIKAKVEAKRATTDAKPSTHFRRIYYEGFDCGRLSAEEMTARFGGLWLLGKKSHWTGKIAKGAYHLSNLHGKDAMLCNQIRYYEPSNQLVDLGNCRVSARIGVSPPNDNHSGAGLLLRYQAESGDCYAFFLHPGSSVSFAEIRNGKLKFLFSSEVPENKTSTLVNLKAVCADKDISLLVNESLVHTFAKAELMGGNVGCIALSVGRFAVDDFAIYTPH